MAKGGDEGLSFISLDDLEPRPPPRLNRFPAPFDFPEKPRTMVPDVSLILESSTPPSRFNGSSSSNLMTASALLLHNKSLSPNISSTSQPRPQSSNGGYFSTVSPTTQHNSGANQRMPSPQNGNGGHFSTVSPSSTAQSNISPGANQRMPTPSPQNGGGYFSTVSPTAQMTPKSTLSTPTPNGMGDLGEIWKELKSLHLKLDSQKGIISKVEEKLEKLVDFQEKFLSQLFRKGSAVSQSVQTDSPQSPPKIEGGQGSRKSPPILHNVQKPLPKSVRNLQKSPDDSSSLSAMMKELKLPTGIMNEGSLFSEMTSMKSLELQEFNDDDSFSSSSGGGDSPILGASASDYNRKNSSSISPPSAKRNQNQNTSAKSREERDFRDRDRILPPKPNPGEILRNYERQWNNASTPCNSNSQKRLVNSPHSSSSGSGESVENKENYNHGANANLNARGRQILPYQQQQQMEKNERNEELAGDDVVQATKNYLATLGVQFGSSSGRQPLGTQNQNRNYMIQQNVYNSIYIPTVNCAPVIPEAIENNPGGPGSNFHSLAQKYVSPEDLQQFEAIRAEVQQPLTSETTVYGMTPSNLSFATKDYLQRYGLVNGDSELPPTPRNSPRILSPQLKRVAMSEGFQFQPSGRILDITAIKNQPKLL